MLLPQFSKAGFEILLCPSCAQWMLSKGVVQPEPEKPGYDATTERHRRKVRTVASIDNAIRFVLQNSDLLQRAQVQLAIREAILAYHESEHEGR